MKVLIVLQKKTTRTYHRKFISTNFKTAKLLSVGCQSTLQCDLSEFSGNREIKKEIQKILGRNCHVHLMLRTSFQLAFSVIAMKFSLSQGESLYLVTYQQRNPFHTPKNRIHISIVRIKQLIHAYLQLYYSRSTSSHVKFAFAS